uniref:RING-type domain-containing protein n=1 Tax=Biomphalaria glabrata TaxID=6526 RepID=A0A2C9L3L5_BIOGL
MSGGKRISKKKQKFYPLLNSNQNHRKRTHKHTQATASRTSEMSSHFNSNSKATLAENTPAFTLSDTPAIAPSDRSSIDANVIQISVVSNTAVSAVSDTPATDVKETQVIAVSETAISAVSDTSATDVKETQVIAVSETAVSAVSNTPAIDAKETQVIAVSETAVSAVSDTPTIALSDTPGGTQVNVNAFSCTPIISDSISTTLGDTKIIIGTPEAATLINDMTDEPDIEKVPNKLKGTPNILEAVKDSDGVTKTSDIQHFVPPEDEVEYNGGVTKNILIEGLPRGAYNMASYAKNTVDAPTEFHNDAEIISDLNGIIADDNHYGINLKKEQDMELDNRAPTHAELNIITTLPKYQKYANPSKRNKSFQKSPKIFYENHKVLYKAGFFYTDSLLSEPGVTGPEKCSGVICFYCGLGLIYPRSDILSLHAALAPKCPYVLLQKGRADVEDTLRHGSKEEKQDTKTVTSSHNNASSDIAVSLLVQEGYDLNKVLEAADQLKQEDDLLTRLDPHKANNPLSDTARKLKEENSLLRKIRICKTCQENPVQVVHLPCGHWIHCVDCAITEGLINNVCRNCRKQVKGLVRGNLSK